MIGLETARLVFRQWKNEDLPTIAEFFSIENNARYVGGVKSQEASWRMMATYIGHYELYGYSYLAVTEKATGHLVGTVGLWNSPSWPEPELAYWLLTADQGQGYGVEAGAAVKTYALEILKLDTLVSYIAPANKPSIKLALKLGAQYDSTIQLLDFGKHGIYRYK